MATVIVPFRLLRRVANEAAHVLVALLIALGPIVWFCVSGTLEFERAKDDLPFEPVRWRHPLEPNGRRNLAIRVRMLHDLDRRIRADGLNQQDLLRLLGDEGPDERSLHYDLGSELSPCGIDAVYVILDFDGEAYTGMRFGCR